MARALARRREARASRSDRSDTGTTASAVVRSPVRGTVATTRPLDDELELVDGHDRAQADAGLEPVLARGQRDLAAGLGPGAPGGTDRELDEGPVRGQGAPRLDRGEEARVLERTVELREDAVHAHRAAQRRVVGHGVGARARRGSGTPR